MMEHCRLGNIADFHAGTYKTLGQFHVFKTGQFFVELVLFPCLPSQRRIGVVAEEAILWHRRDVGEVFGKNAPLTVIAIVIADLAAIAIGCCSFDQGGAEVSQPVAVRWHAVPRDQHKKITLAG